MKFRLTLGFLLNWCLTASVSFAGTVSECPPPRVIIDAAPLTYQVNDFRVRTCYNQFRNFTGPIDSTLIFANPEAIPDLGEAEIPLRGMFFYADRGFELPPPWNLDGFLGPVVGTEVAGSVEFDIRFKGAPSKSVYWLSDDPPMRVAFSFTTAPDPLRADYNDVSYINIQQPWKDGVIAFKFNFPEKSSYFKGDASRRARAIGATEAALDMRRLMNWADLTETLNDEKDFEPGSTKP
ncbi:hypothetical protein [Thioclava sp. F28-4]|uniref:hypothetical protein n=1 Tax=Thioclava sp. F28-4 TaxID=1915315 RepID=UPI000998AA49|nr:hypothetical protein [Thioclava sp. F28-4]OOY05866.1 hypothetical protein BMI87_07635 [Thioclava sp. F28-4]